MASTDQLKELLQRLQTAQPAEPDSEATRAVLQARAVQLAARPDPGPTGPCLECLEFQLSGERYALELSYISQTLPLGEFTPLFCTPPFVLGITNLRGRILSIVDLRRFFELPEVGLSDLNRVLVVGDGTVEFGLLADAIAGVISLPTAEIKPPPAALTGIREEFLVGVTADRLALLDIAKILRDRRILVYEEVS
jgi:purine-binding chemotaxis protein CheW